MSSATSPRLGGAPNFRDLGGYKTLDGQVVKSGHLFRSGNFSQLTPADFDVLRQLSLRTIIDLRGASEMQMYPSRFPEGFDIAIVNVVVNPYTHADANAYKQILLDDPTASGALKTITATYQLLPDACGPALKVTVDQILDGATPLAFHCANGRDRTGVISIMLLHMLGVSRDDIVADYVESNARIDLDTAIALSKKSFTKEYGCDFDYETLRTMNQALEANVDIVFDTIAKKYGSLQLYLEAFGINAKEQNALREKLLESL